jgi:CO/xanthine dehydrogenase FAD-binding subunit
MSPALVLDGSEDSAADAAAASAYSQAGDQWASAEYRSQTAQTLTRRCLAQLTALS